MHCEGLICFSLPPNIDENEGKSCLTQRKRPSMKPLFSPMSSSTSMSYTDENISPQIGNEKAPSFSRSTSNKELEKKKMLEMVPDNRQSYSNNNIKQFSLDLNSTYICIHNISQSIYIYTYTKLSSIHHWCRRRREARQRHRSRSPSCRQGLRPPEVHTAPASGPAPTPA